ncbi:MAG TPA: hypothetical protein VGR22_05720 [Thermomicrobiales bacterium]|nr:hypothetical protein [Thermomicrobiales bacterium]
MRDRTMWRGWTIIGALGRALVLIGLMLALVTATFSPGATAQGDGEPQVMIIPIEGAVEPGLGAYLDRSIEEAEESGIATIILDIDTPGGRLDTVLEMRDAILDTAIPVVAFVNRQAFSAGALITIASDEIWMTPGAVFGAATPISGATGETADEKTISAVRSTFRATAEEQGLDPEIAEAMVDPNVVVEGLDGPNSLLTLTTEQALAYDYADGVAQSREDLLAELGFEDVEVVVASPTFFERVVRFITDPALASILILLGLAMVVLDGLVGGFGVMALIGAGLLGIFFYGHLLAGFAGWEDVVLVVVGLILIAIEVFVIPGFGVAGLLGGISLIGGLVLAMTSRDFGDEGFSAEAGDALQTLLITLSLTVLVIVLVAWGLPRLVPSVARPARGLQRMTLSSTVSQGNDRESKPGYFTRLLGGHDVVERDTEGHTAVERRRRADPGSPRDPARDRHI